MGIDTTIETHEPDIEDAVVSATSTPDRTSRIDSMLDRSATWDLLVAIKLLTFAVILVIRPFNISHDCGLLLHASEQLLDGAVPYVDFFEQNPPLIYYLLAIPVWMARAIEVNPIPVYQAFFLLIVVITTLMVRRLLHAASSSLSGMQRGLTLLAFVIANECTLLAPDFGQREHWFAILFVPFILLRWLSLREDRPARSLSTAYRVGLGIAAGVGIALKHHFVAIWLGIELFCILRKRTRRVAFAPESIAVGFFLLAYLAHFLFVPASMRTGFFHRWVPFVMSHYWVYRHAIDLPHVMFVSAISIVSVAASLLAWRINRRNSSEESLVLLFGLLTLLSLASFVIQGKDFSYHLIPLYFGMFPCIALYSSAIVRCGRRLSTGLARLGIIGVVLGTVPSAAAEIGLSWVIGRPRDEPTPIWREILSRSKSGDPILFISTNVGDGYPDILRHGYATGSRYLVSMPIALVHSDIRNADDGSLYHNESNRPECETRYLQELAIDLARRKPALVAIVDQENCQGCAPGFNVHEFLRYSGFAADNMTPYRDLGRFEGKISTFRLYGRQPSRMDGGTPGALP